MESIAQVVVTRSNSRIGLDEILEGMSGLETPAIEQFLKQVASLVARRKSPNLSERESELLEAINQSIPSELQDHFKKFSNKMQSGTISENEYQEMLSLVDILEGKYAIRLQKLIELSQFRGVSLDVLMEQLQLSPNKIYG